MRILVFASLLLITPSLVRAERDLSIEAISLNGFAANEIRVKPGARIAGNVIVNIMSSSILRTHSAVWLPSWQKEQGAMRVFFNSKMGIGNATAQIDIAAPTDLGTHYLLFCFDRKSPAEMFPEITSRSNFEIFSSGRAIRIIVDTEAYIPPQPPPDTTIWLNIGGVPLVEKAGNGAGLEAILKMPTRWLSSERDDAVRITVVGEIPTVDLDFEVLDGGGRRRGASEAEGGQSESSIVRVWDNETLTVRVFAFKRGEASPFRITAERVSLARSRRDPGGSAAVAAAAIPAGDNFAVTGHAGSSFATSAWYKVPLMKNGSIQAVARGAAPDKDLDLWIYDDLGNPRGTSREDGSRVESAVVDPAESAVYYVRIGAFQKKDESAFSLTLRVTGGGITASAPIVTTPVVSTPQGETPRAFDTGTKPPVPYEIARGKDFEGYVRVQDEASFMLEIYTGWGDIGKIDVMRVTAPDGSVLWEKRADGRGWEGDKIATKGPGYYRIHLSHTGDGVRKGRIDVDNLADKAIYKARPRVDLGAGGSGLDAAEKEYLKTLYDMMSQRGPGISPEEADFLKKLEEYFQLN